MRVHVQSAAGQEVLQLFPFVAEMEFDVPDKLGGVEAMIEAVLTDGKGCYLVLQTAVDRAGASTSKRRAAREQVIRNVLKFKSSCAQYARHACAVLGAVYLLTQGYEWSHDLLADKPDLLWCGPGGQVST